MAYLRNFLLFWFDFIVGDDWVIATGVVIALLAATQLSQRGLSAWWLVPVAVAALLAVSIWRGTRRSP
jgi:uncharacterized protein (DUF58 family)